jgi:hypothetical protein
MSRRSTASTSLCTGVLWMGRARGRRGGQPPSHPLPVSGGSLLLAGVNPANPGRKRVFPRFSHAYCYGFEESVHHFHALSFLPAAPRTHR